MKQFWKVHVSGPHRLVLPHQRRPRIPSTSLPGFENLASPANQWKRDMAPRRPMPMSGVRAELSLGGLEHTRKYNQYLTRWCYAITCYHISYSRDHGLFVGYLVSEVVPISRLLLMLCNSDFWLRKSGSAAFILDDSRLNVNEEDQNCSTLNNVHQKPFHRTSPVLLNVQ